MSNKQKQAVKSAALLSRTQEELRQARYWTSVQHMGSAEKTAADVAWIVALSWVFAAIGVGQ